jgi:uncharacterized membrane protein YkvA (DUF1232 family)
VNGEAGEHENSSALGRLGARSAQALRAVLLDIRFLYFVFINPVTPWYARVLLFLPLAYLCSPIQLIPNFIPVLGQMDDLFVIWLSNRLVRRLVNSKVLDECRERAAAVSFSIRFSGKSFHARHTDPATAGSDAVATKSADLPVPGGSALAQETDAHGSRSAP